MPCLLLIVSVVFFLFHLPSEIAASALENSRTKIAAAMLLSFRFDIDHRRPLHFPHDVLRLQLMQMVAIAVVVLAIERWTAAVVGRRRRQMVCVMVMVAVHVVHPLDLDLMLGAEHIRAHDVV